MSLWARHSAWHSFAVLASTGDAAIPNPAIAEHTATNTVRILPPTRFCRVRQRAPVEAIAKHVSKRSQGLRAGGIRTRHIERGPPSPSSPNAQGGEYRP